MSIDVKSIAYKTRYLIVITVLMAALSVATPAFLTFTNLINVIWSVAIIGIISVGATFVILVGKIDLSVASIAALTGIIATQFITDRQMDFIAAIILALAAASLLGFLNGVIVALTKIPEFIATFAMSSILTGLSQVLTGGKTLSIMQPKSYTFLGIGKIFSVPMPVVFFIIAMLLGWLLLNKTVFGRKCYSVGGNPCAARLSGISVNKTIITAYMVTAVAAGFGGIIHNALTQQAGPGMCSGYELDVIASVVIGGGSLSGGAGTMSGTLFGTILFGLINNGLNLLNIPGTYHPIVKGITIIGAVAFNTYSSRNR